VYLADPEIKARRLQRARKRTQELKQDPAWREHRRQLERDRYWRTSRNTAA
jgi:hypothetical protein